MVGIMGGYSSSRCIVKNINNDLYSLDHWFCKDEVSTIFWDFTGRIKYYNDGKVYFEIDYCVSLWYANTIDTLKILYRKIRKLPKLRKTCFVSEKAFYIPKPKITYTIIECAL